MICFFEMIMIRPSDNMPSDSPISCGFWDKFNHRHQNFKISKMLMFLFLFSFNAITFFAKCLSLWTIYEAKEIKKRPRFQNFAYLEDESHFHFATNFEAFLFIKLIVLKAYGSKLGWRRIYSMSFVAKKFLIPKYDIYYFFSLNSLWNFFLHFSK